MSFPLLLIAAFFSSLGVSLLAARPLTEAPETGRYLDPYRHSHTGHIPRLGGVAVFAGVLVGTLIALLAIGHGAHRPATLELTTVLVSSAILFLIGLVDDLKGVPPLGKLSGQIVAALIVYYGGFQIHSLALLPGHALEVGWLAFPITALWLVGVSNAFNLIDGLDGLAGGTALIGLLAVTAVALLLGNPTVPLYAIALSGALLGFLRFNFPPARLFLGDSGSLVVGFLLAVLTVKGATRPDHVLMVLAPVFALSYPLLDTGVAILRRWLRGVPLSRPDRSHIHHQLQALGLGPRRSIGLIYAGSLFIAALGVFAAAAPLAVTIVAAISGAVVLFLIFGYGLQLLEYHEFHAAGSFFASGLSKARLVIQDTINARDVAAVVRLANTYAELEAILEDSATNFRFAHMELRSSIMPPSHVWTGKYRTGPFWKLEYPIAPQTITGVPPIFLTIWCASDESQAPSGAERVLHILVPAIIDCLVRAGTIPRAAAIEELMSSDGSGPAAYDRKAKENSATSRGISVRA